MGERIQLSRQKGWRMPLNTVKVDRSTKWGNPFRAGDPNIADRETAVRRFAEIVHEDTARAHFYRQAVQQKLRGKNLACWCPLCEVHRNGKPFGVECADCSPCHVDVLLELANASLSSQPDSGEAGA